MAPAVLFIDELDVVAQARATSSNDTFGKEIVGQLLQEMDGITKENRHLFVLAATNDRKAIDPAVLSRFTDDLYIPLPDRNARERLLKILLNAAKAEATVYETVGTLAGSAEGFSGRDLKNWIAKAQQHAVMKAMKAGGPSQYRLAAENLVATKPTFS